MRRTIGVFAAAALTMVLVPTVAAAQDGPHEIRLRVSALEPISGALYEVWVVVGDTKHSAGTFNVAGDGSLVDASGGPAHFASPVDPATADAIAVTVEPVPDPDPGPTATVILVGSPGASSAKLRFPIGLGKASGSFILATPTTAATDDETSGAWFLDPAGGPGPSLRLPALPEGWVFEGWGVTQATPLSTGQFTEPTGSDQSAPFSGPLPGPPFPGEDFVANLPPGVSPPVNLADGSSMIVITLEPDVSGSDPTGAGPFSIKPLVVVVPSGTPPMTSVELGLDLSTVPSGQARF